VKVHRSRAMRKMNAHSLPELGRMADRLKLVSEKPQTSRTKSHRFLRIARPPRPCALR
jgi:hypothetical protein